MVQKPTLAYNQEFVCKIDQHFAIVYYNFTVSTIARNVIDISYW